VVFDLFGTGNKVQTGWISAEDGFLVIDNNENGEVDDINDLFGGSVGEGFAKLETFDSNKDGTVDAQDKLFNQLKIWQDSNSNGITDQGELQSLSAHGISSLNVNYTNQFTMDAQGNVLGEVSNATTNEGKSLDMIDIYFQVK
jgi:hypothetical protein